MTKPLSACRLCGHIGLLPTLDLGPMSSCGVFPATPADNPPAEPIEVGRCLRCGLAQLMHEFDPADTFKAGFGYRSAGNPEMVEHLSVLAGQVATLADLRGGDMVIDIGSNDGTFLSFLPQGVAKIGVDPCSPVNWVGGPEMALHGMFWGDEFWAVNGEMYEEQAAAVTCFACLYDVPDLQGFMKLVAKALKPGGWFICEVAYLPAMIANNGFDIISHEHLSYFRLRDLERLCQSAGLSVRGGRETATQGGSILIWAQKTPTPRPHAELFAPDHDTVHPDEWARFAFRIAAAKARTLEYLKAAKADGQRIHGLCASTKGATLLQAFGIGPDLVSCVAEKDPHKWGRFMPGSLIPIVSEKQSREERPDLLLVLSHQFRRSLVARENAFLERGGFMLFPIPNFETVTQ